ncbi:uncharacterized protein LOC122948464 [Acropora millepora]|uniref:uncharacterized protein LOC122948464 n=1 Tax=Acropora millepora TaxID=45264 RepID=UPI001CF4C5DC|nr:uncharacterized protein LOC122948464 [Acropora millepora]
MRKFGYKVLRKQRMTENLLSAYFAWFLLFQLVQPQFLSAALNESSAVNNTSIMMTTSSPSTNNMEQKCNFGQLSVCWRASPPYIMNDTRSGQMTGIFHDAINKIVSESCNGEVDERGNASWLHYNYEASNFSDLNECMRGGYDIVLPILFSQQIEDNLYLRIRSHKLIRTPGIAVIKNGKKLEEAAKANVLDELKEYWTVLVLVVLLSFIFGILMWFLDSHTNSEEFPQEFFRGSLDGVWWAFVTMVTVGYGDKVPRFLLARIVAVIWMFLSVIVMTYLTGVMTATLTFGTLTDNGNIGQKKMGVLDGSQEYLEGWREGAIVTQYRDLEALAGGFAEDEVEGLLLDAFVASYMLNNKWPTRINSVQFERVKILDRPFPIGLYAPRFKKLHPKLEYDLQKGIKKYHDRDIYAIAYEYVRPKLNDIGQSSPWNKRLYLFNSREPLFKKCLYVLLGILAALLVIGSVLGVVKRQRKQSFNLNRKGHKMPINMRASLTKGELRDVMESIGEVEKCLGKILELKEAYKKLDNY